MEALSYLDISNARIVQGGNNYYSGFSTSDNVIGDQMFYDMSKLETVKIPKTVTSISTQAFYGCQNLTTIELSPILTSIGYWAFMGCHKLNNVILSNTLTHLDSGAFCGCSSITEITLPESLTSMSTYVFKESGLKIITLPKNLRTLDNRCFENCKNLSEVHIKALPTTLTNIGSDLFSNDTYKSACLFVPEGTKSAYYLTEFGKFKNIIEE
jgi:hypothetical protein